MRQLLRLSVLSSLCLCVSVVQSPADWPLFRGNALQTGVADSTLPPELTVRWKFPTKDSIEAAAAIVDGVVYVGSMDEHLYAIDLKTGKQKWKTKLGPIKAAPSVKSGAVYVGDEEGIFHCVDAATGKPRWKYETAGEIVSSANFASDRVLFGSGDSLLYCLTREGKLIWKFRIEGGPVMGSPAVVEQRTFVAGCDSKLHVIDIATGKELAAVELDGQAGATAAIAGERLYVGTMGNVVQAVDWKKAEIAWTYEPKRAQAFYSSAAVTEKLVVVGSRDKQVHALDRAKGKLVWAFPTKGRVDSSPVIAGKRVFVGSNDGNLYVVDLEKGKELRKFELGRGILASPAVGEGCLVIGTTDGVLYCLGKKD